MKLASCDLCNRALKWGEVVVVALKNKKVIWVECMHCTEATPESQQKKITKGITWSALEYGKTLTIEK